MEDWEEVFEELEDPCTGNAKRHLRLDDCPGCAKYEQDCRQHG